MYKTHAALGVVFAVVLFSAVKINSIMPTPAGTTVIAEKTDGVRVGGKMAILVPGDLKLAQHQVLNQALLQAKADGHNDPAIIQGIILQESKAGAMASYRVAGNKGDEYFGLGQIKLAAARDVMVRWPELWEKYKFQTKTDDELKANLILNEKFNIEIVSKYLRLLQDRYGFTGVTLINAYNRGPGGVSAVDASFHYGRGVLAHAATLRKKK